MLVYIKYIFGCYMPFVLFCIPFFQQGILKNIYSMGKFNILSFRINKNFKEIGFVAPCIKEYLFKTTVYLWVSFELKRKPLLFERIQT